MVDSIDDVIFAIGKECDAIDCGSCEFNGKYMCATRLAIKKCILYCKDFSSYSNLSIGEQKVFKK
jgi:hypothetical protein